MNESSFKLTEQSLENLRKKNYIPDSILEGLKAIEDKAFPDEETFMRAIEMQIGNEQTAIYKQRILEYTEIQDAENEYTSPLYTTKNISKNLNPLI